MLMLSANGKRKHCNRMPCDVVIENEICVVRPTLQQLQLSLPAKYALMEKKERQKMSDSTECSTSMISLSSYYYLFICWE